MNCHMLISNFYAHNLKKPNARASNQTNNFHKKSNLNFQELRNFCYASSKE
jgi:hypothetical protein